MLTQIMRFEIAWLWLRSSRLRAPLGKNNMFFRRAIIAGGLSLVLGVSIVRAQVTFTDVSAEVGIGAVVSESGMGAGVAVADFDDDGYVDIFVPQAEGTPNLLYRNLGNGTFEEIAGQVGLDSLESARTALWFDYDDDNDLDLIVMNDRLSTPSAYRLYRQSASGQFTDVTIAAGLFVPPSDLSEGGYHRGGICAGDIDNDGDLDFFTVQWSGRGQLYLNRGDGTFRDYSVASGIAAVERSMHQPMMADFNEDGLLDIYVAVDFIENLLWINQGNSTFVDMAAAAGADNAMDDMGLTLGDYDNDGDFDIYITNIYVNPSGDPLTPERHNVLLRNNFSGGQLTFEDVSVATGVEMGHFGWGTTFMDYDNDGLLDLAATNGFLGAPSKTDESRMFRNVQGAAAPFDDVSVAVNFNDTFWGSSLVAFDYDRDGDLDLLQVCKDGLLRLLDNEPAEPAASNNYLVIKPRMPVRNRRAIGAVVRVTLPGGPTLSRLITAGTSYLGQEPAEAFFGVGTVSEVDSVTVEWPGGQQTTIANVAVNQVLVVNAPFGTSIPTASGWGQLILLLSIAVAATVTFRAGRARINCG